MRHSLSLLPLTIVLAGAAACGRSSNATRTDTATGVVDTAPVTTATGVFTLLADENVFAVLDTGYAAMAQFDQAAASKATSPQVRDFATQSVNGNALSRRAVVATAQRLNVSPVLPDKEVVKDERKVLGELRAKSGSDFDQYYVHEASRLRGDMVDEIDDALKSTKRKDETRTLLNQLRATLVSERKTLDGLMKK